LTADFFLPSATTTASWAIRPSATIARNSFISVMVASRKVRQVAISAGATGDLIEKVAAQMVSDKMVRIDRAEEILKGMTA